MVSYEAMTPQCMRSVIQVLVVRVDIGVVVYEAMTQQFGRSLVKVLFVRVDIGVVTYAAMRSQCVASGSCPDCQSRYRSGAYEAMTDPGCQGGNIRVIYTFMKSRCRRSVVQV